MSLNWKFKSWNHAEPDLTLKEHVAARLEGDDYGVGQVEAAKAQADNLVEAFGLLLEVLGEKGIITKDDIHKIVGGGE